jgi:hypothetical protein
VFYSFLPSGIPLLQDTHHHQVSITDGQGRSVPITHKNVFTPRLNLGHLKCPSRGTKLQAEVLLTKATKISTDITLTNCSREEARTLYESCFRPAIEYVLPQSFITSKQLSTITKKSMPAIFAKCGYNRNTSRNVLFGPLNLGGAGFMPLATTASTGHVLHFLKFWRSPTTDAGKLLRITLAWSQFQAGVSFPVLANPNIDLPHLQGKFIPAIRQHLSLIDSHINLDTTFVTPPLRRNDKAIMEQALELNFTAIQLKKINCVRMFLGVTYLSEITHPNGNHLQSSIQTPSYRSRHYQVTSNRPQQQQPNQASWNLWNQVLASLTISSSRRLKSKLGQWSEFHSQNGLWNVYQSENGHIYERNPESPGWTEYKRAAHRRLYVYARNVDFTPSRYDIPSYINKLTNNTKFSPQLKPIPPLLNRAKGWDPISPPGSSLTWSDMIARQPLWVRSFTIGSEFFFEPGEMIEQICTNSEVLAVSDGSVKGNRMTYGWILALRDGTRLARGNGSCPGRPSSMRSEAAGMLSVALILATLQRNTLFALNHSQVHFMADNKALITRQLDHQSFTTNYPNQTLLPEFDLTEQIYSTLFTHKIQSTFSHVKGHQDDSEDISKLCLNAQLNVEADRLAEQYYSTGFAPNFNVPTLPACPAMLFIRGIAITNDYTNQLVRAHTEPQYIQHLQQKFKWSNPTTEIIAWKALSVGLNRINRQCLAVKVCNDLMPTASTLKKQKYQSQDTCCLCQQTETREHMIVCSHVSRHKWRIKFIQALRTRMKQLKTQAGILDTFCSALTEWFDSQKVTPSKYHVRYRKAIISQTNIGWRQIFMGKISQDWERLQGSTKVTDSTYRASYLWSASIVELSLTHFISLWEQRNTDVHVTNSVQQQQMQKERQQTRARLLIEKQPLCRPSDHSLFPSNPEEFLTNSTIHQLSTWIATNQQAIENSTKQASVLAIANTNPVTRYFPPLPSTNSSRSRQWHQDKLIHDPYSKKKKRKGSSRAARQPTLLHFLSLRNKI